MKTQRGNFMLTDGGVMLDRDAADDVDGVAQQLFDELVRQHGKQGQRTTAKEEKARTESVKKTCRDTLNSLGVLKHPNMQTTWETGCQIRGASHDFIFDFRWHPDGVRPQLINAVNIGHKLSVFGNAFTFEHASQAKTLDLKKAKFAAVINTMDSRLDSTLVSRHIDILQQFGTVIDFADGNGSDQLKQLCAI